MAQEHPRSRSPQSVDMDLPSRPDKKARLESQQSPVSQDNSLLAVSHLPSNSGAIPQIATAMKAEGKKITRKSKMKHKHTTPEPYTAEFVVARDVTTLLGQTAVDQAIADGSEWDTPFEHREELELTVSCLSSTGTCIYPSYLCQ